MLKQRVVTALLIFPLVLGLFFSVALEYFAAIIIIIVYLIALEWARLCDVKKPQLQSLYALLISFINIVVWQLSDDFKFWPSPSWPNYIAWDYPLIILMLGLVAIVLVLFIVMTYSLLPKWWANFSFRAVMGAMLLPAFFVSLVSLRSIESLSDFYYGGQLLLMMFCMIWAADTGAYIAGKMFGKHKLAVNLSPNKTWEGAFGGVALSVAIAWWGASLLNLNIQQPALYLFVVLGLAIISVLGDLFESALKRAAGVKDSGNLLPGHGGILDRLDSSIIVAPLFYVIFSYLGWI